MNRLFRKLLSVTIALAILLSTFTVFHSTVFATAADTNCDLAISVFLDSLETDGIKKTEAEYLNEGGFPIFPNQATTLRYKINVMSQSLSSTNMVVESICCYYDSNFKLLEDSMSSSNPDYSIQVEQAETVNIDGNNYKKLIIENICLPDSGSYQGRTEISLSFETPVGYANIFNDFYCEIYSVDDKYVDVDSTPGNALVDGMFDSSEDDSAAFLNDENLQVCPYGLKYEVKNKSVTITNYIGKSGIDSLYIPSTIDGLAVTDIGTRAFCDNKSGCFEKIFIPSSVKKIDTCAFGSVSDGGSISSMKYISLSEGVNWIGSRAFYNCKDLQSINLPSTVNSISATNLKLNDGSTASLYGSFLSYGLYMYSELPNPSISEINVIKDSYVDLYLRSIVSNSGVYAFSDLISYGEKVYTVNYCGDWFATETRPAKNGETVDLSLKAQKIGCEFVGWNTDPNATENLTSLKMGDKDITLYAVWKPNTYTVKYNANGGTGTMSSSSHTFDTAKALTANAFTRPGYTFLGWSTDSTATEAEFADGASVMNLTVTNGATVTLYAVWKANTYTVAYHANGGTGSMANSSHTYGTAKALTANTFTRTGYTFLGWATSATATTATYTNAQSVKNLTAINGGTVTLYAVWKPNAYTVKYNANGGTGSMANSSHTYDTAKALTANTFTRTGYTFLGWSTGATATSAKYADKESVKNLTATNGGTVTLYAVWQPNRYTVVTNANGGTGTALESTFRYDTIGTLPSNSFTRTGYTFLGWSTSPTATTPTYTDKQSVKNLTTTNGGTVTLYAVWKANTYTVAYNANGGTGSMSSSSHTYDTAKALTANTFTRTGYTFLGWSTSPTATTATYTNAQSVKNLTATNGGTVTLYAVWEKNAPVTVYGDANGDGMIDAGDAVLVSRYDAGEITLTAEQLKACDVNGDGIVDAGDAVLISRYDAGLINGFPVV